MNPQQTRDLVHNIINFVTDEVSRKLAETTTTEWSATANVDMLTNEQAMALSELLGGAIRQAAFTVLSQTSMDVPARKRRTKKAKK